MTDFFQWLSSGSLSAIVLITLFIAFVIFEVSIFVITFREGREITFYPPKLGEKLIDNKSSKNSSKANIIKFLAYTLIGIIAVVILLMVLGPHIGETYKIKHPPTAILQIQGVEQIGETGSYCWDGGCSDVFALLTPKKPLFAKSPFVFTLKLSTDTPLSSLSMSINSASKMKEIPTSAPLRVWEIHRENYDDLSLKQEQTINLQLKPDLYVIILVAQWQQRGDAMYGFLIDVK